MTTAACALAIHNRIPQRAHDLAAGRHTHTRNTTLPSNACIATAALVFHTESGGKQRSSQRTVPLNREKSHSLKLTDYRNIVSRYLRLRSHGRNTASPRDHQAQVLPHPG